MRSNYTTTAGSLIKLRATRLIRLCDLQIALTAHCAALILSNQYYNDALLIADVVMSTVAVWPLTSFTSNGFQFFPQFTHSVLKDTVLCIIAIFMKDNFDLVLKEFRSLTP